jgi:hypothetical protein
LRPLLWLAIVSVADDEPLLLLLGLLLSTSESDGKLCAFRFDPGALKSSTRVADMYDSRASLTSLLILSESVDSFKNRLTESLM